MPQMSTLMWSNLFLLFTFLLLLSSVKIYFFSDKKISGQKFLSESKKMGDLNWTW